MNNLAWSTIAATAALLVYARTAAGQPAMTPTSAGEPAVPAEPAVPTVAAPVPVPPTPPAGVPAEFVSTSGMQWEVLVDQQPACVTPCTLQLDQPRWITVRTRERQPLRLEVGELGSVPVRVTAKPLGTGKYATGVTFTALGGTALVTGIVLTAVGCTTSHDGLCTAGLITGGSGAVVTAGAIWLMRRGLPRVRVRALERRGVAVYATGTGGGIAGRF